jgi:hypothetical protein
MAVTVQCSCRDFFAYARTLADGSVKFAGGLLRHSLFESVPKSRRKARHLFSCFRYNPTYCIKSRLAFLANPSP